MVCTNIEGVKYIYLVITITNFLLHASTRLQTKSNAEN